ncbi:hypothetical protein ACROYT_G043149 [Oculina patagonica]
MSADDDSSGIAYDDIIEFSALEYGGNTFIKQLNINVPDARGHVVIGGKQATITGVPTAQGREDARFHPGNTSTTQAPAVGSSTSISNAKMKQQENQHFNDRSSQVNLFYTKNSPGSYCPHNYYQQTNVGDWSPKPVTGIFIQRGEIDFQWSVESFLENPERFIREMDTCAGSLKEEKEKFILLGILPYLEQFMWGKSSANNIETYKVLAQASCIRSSSDVAKHSLQQLEHLLCRDNLDNSKQNLLSVEKIIRLSIVSPDGSFKEEADSIRLLRLSVYSRILSELIIHQIQSGFSMIDLKNNLKKLKELKAYFNLISLKKKDILRYSIDFIQEAISYLLPKSSSKTLTTHLGLYLEECKALCANKQIAEKEFSLFQKLRASKVKWLDLHCILYYLHGKVHNKHPTPQMHKERRAMILLRRVVEANLDGGGGADWRFCLLAASLLAEISMNNVTKELRIEAGSCLVSLLKNQKAQKRPECRAILDRFSKRVLFCQECLIKKLLVPHLYDNQNAQYTLPADLHIEHLTNGYKTQTLEVNNAIVSELGRDKQYYFVYDGTLKGQKVAVKILGVTKQDILEETPTVQTEAKKRLIAEAYNLWQLNSLPDRHPNIPVLLAYNTATLPYHIITEYEKHGNLLQLVRASRQVQVLPSTVLYKIFIGITEGLLYLHEKLHLVHRVVMAENILVGDGYTCKLSGLHSLGMLQNGPYRDDQGYDHAMDDLPVFISEIDDSLPVRWKAPECLLEHSYSTLSDVWAFGMLLYEVLTLGCRPYRHIREDALVANHVLQKDDEEVLPQESCFIDDEYKLMKQCWKRQRNERIGLFQLQEELIKMRSKMKSGEETPRPNPPHLELDIVNPQELNELVYDLNYDAIPDHRDVERSQTIYEGYEDVEVMLERRDDTSSMPGDDVATYMLMEDCRDDASSIPGDNLATQAMQERRDFTSSMPGDDVATLVMQGRRDDTSSMPVDLPTNYQLDQDVRVIKERITYGEKQHLRRLLTLRNNNLLPIYRIDNLDSYSPVVDILSPRSQLGSLREYVLSRRCQKDDIITFLCQVATAVHYLHVNHIVHGDLRAEYVYVVEPNKVQVGRMGRSKPLSMSAYEVTSTSCVVEEAMPYDSTRWSAPEVISASRYSHASDVWAFGILAWELYTAFAVGQNDRIISLPYYNIKTDKLSLYKHMREVGPLTQPDGCPDWVYIMMHQCWTFEPIQRPPFIAILDCLSSREPMKSWMMTLWLNNHEKREWPELPIFQPEDACHVTRAEEHPSKEVIETMCSEGFFTHHKYRYIEMAQRSVTDTVDEEVYECCEPHQSAPESLPLDHHSDPECSSTVSISLVEGDVTDPTGLLHDTRNYSYRPTSPREQTAEQNSELPESDDSKYSYQTAEEEPYEYYNLPESPTECLSTDSISSDHNSELAEGDVTDPTGNSERPSHDTTNDSHRRTSLRKQTAEQDSEFSGSNDSNSSYAAYEEMLVDESGCSTCQPEDAFFVNLQYKLTQKQSNYRENEKEEEPNSSHYVNEICEDDAGEAEVDMREIRLDDDAGYKELNTSNKDYMPLTKDHLKAEEPCYINSENEDFKTKLTQCSSHNSVDKCYMCVDLGQGLQRGQEDERSSTDPVNSVEYYQIMDNQLNYDPHEDMAIQDLLNAAECLYQDILQKRNNGQKAESNTAGRFYWILE